MIFCPICRSENEVGANFCRFCGHQFSALQTQPSASQYEAAPRPYMWKTDEFQISQQPQNTNQYIQSPPIPAPYNFPFPADTHNRHFVGGYRCPRCGTQTPPYLTRQISTAGWITFGVLMVTTLIFCWIGLLMKENVTVCPICNYRYS